MTARAIRIPFLFLAAVLSLAYPALAAAADESEPLRAGTVLAVDVWQHPELSREIEVGQDGRVDYPPLGGMRAEGLTAAALAQRIGDGLTAYIRETAYVSAREVFPVTVNGFVARPGRIAFPHPPTVIEAIMEAGGPQPGAWLDRVIVFRKTASNEMQLVDVSGAFAGGGATASPTLGRQDVVLVRGETPSGGGVAGATGGATGGAPGAPGGAPSGVVVLQGVVAPGVYPLPAGSDAYTALAQARGPAPDADLSRTVVLSRQGDERVAYRVDLSTPGEGNPPRAFPLKDGDVVQVGGEHVGWRSRIWSGTQGILAASRDIVAAYFLYHALVK